MSLLVLDSAYVQETAPVKYVAFWKCHIVLICLLERRRKKNCMTAWIGPATLPFSNSWLEDILKRILLDSGRWYKGNKEQSKKHSEYFIYHLQAGPYLNAVFWPYCGPLQSRDASKCLSTVEDIMQRHLQRDPSQELWMTARCRATL